MGNLELLRRGVDLGLTSCGELRRLKYEELHIEAQEELEEYALSLRESYFYWEDIPISEIEKLLVLILLVDGYLPPLIYAEDYTVKDEGEVETSQYTTDWKTTLVQMERMEEDAFMELLAIGWRGVLDITEEYQCEEIGRLKKKIDTLKRDKNV